MMLHQEKELPNDSREAIKLFIILPIKNKMAATKKQYFFCIFCIKLSLHYRHSTNDYKFSISVNGYQ